MTTAFLEPGKSLWNRSTIPLNPVVSLPKPVLQIPDPAASKSAQVAAAWRALKDTQEDYVTVGEVTRAHIKKQAEAVHGALDRSATQLCEQLRQV